jgi:hypothetical protein
VEAPIDETVRTDNVRVKLYPVICPVQRVHIVALQYPGRQ